MKQHTFDELYEYGRKSAIDNFASSIECCPNNGLSSKRLEDGSFLISDMYSAMKIYFDCEQIKYKILIKNFKKEVIYEWQSIERDKEDGHYVLGSKFYSQALFDECPECKKFELSKRERGRQ